MLYPLPAQYNTPMPFSCHNNNKMKNCYILKQNILNQQSKLTITQKTPPLKRTWQCNKPLWLSLISVRVSPMNGYLHPLHQPSGCGSIRRSLLPPYFQNKVLLCIICTSNSQSVVWIFSRTKSSALFRLVKLHLSPFHVNLRLAGCPNVCFTWCCHIVFMMGENCLLWSDRSFVISS